MFSRNQSISAADIDGDGIVELVTKAKDQKVYAYEHDGTLKWTSVSLGDNTGTLDIAISISDMNGDGAPFTAPGLHLDLILPPRFCCSPDDRAPQVSRLPPLGPRPSHRQRDAGR